MHNKKNLLMRNFTPSSSVARRRLLMLEMQFAKLGSHESTTTSYPYVEIQEKRDGVHKTHFAYIQTIE